HLLRAPSPAGRRPAARPAAPTRAPRSRSPARSPTRAGAAAMPRTTIVAIGDVAHEQPPSTSGSEPTSSSIRRAAWQAPTSGRRRSATPSSPRALTDVRYPATVSVGLGLGKARPATPLQARPAQTVTRAPARPGAGGGAWAGRPERGRSAARG